MIFAVTILFILPHLSSLQGFHLPQSGAWRSIVPELPGCAADGATYQEAVQNVEMGIQEWIAIAQELGRPIPEPKGRLLFA